jgi:hypothetical protein
MSKLFVVALMIFCHIVDDYYLQGILASMKQRSWWEENYPQKSYSYDYIMALAMHAMSWAFMIMLPVAAYMGFRPTNIFFVMLVGNSVIHAIVDDLKANKHKINLIVDQCIHLVQIFVTAAVMLHA